MMVFYLIHPLDTLDTLDENDENDFVRKILSNLIMIKMTII